MRESRSEFAANESLAQPLETRIAAKGDWTKPSPNRFRINETAFDRWLKKLLPIRPR